MEDLSTINYLVSEIIELKATIKQLQPLKTYEDCAVKLTKTNSDLLTYIDDIRNKCIKLETDNAQLMADIKDIRRKKYKQRIEYEYLKLDYAQLEKTNKEQREYIQKLENVWPPPN
jgi:predicted RNase H-like nuclease (RuvC/YqgF family)